MTDETDREVGGSEFVERALYRRRRLVDGLRLLPVLGAGLFMMPALILGNASASTAMRLTYFFVCWIALIGLCAMLVRLLRRRGDG